jgi:hypothetical protein
MDSYAGSIEYIHQDNTVLFVQAPSSVQPTSERAARPPVIEVVDDLMIPCLRAKTPAERLDMAAEMWRFARNTYLALARQQHPDWTPEQIQREARRRMCAGLQYGME